MPTSVRPSAGIPAPVPLPQNDLGPIIPVIRAPARDQIRVTCLSDRLHGVLTHWVEKREMPCACLWGGPCDLCSSCSGVARWTGWIAVWDALRRGTRLLALPAAAVRNCPELGEHEGQLRGLVLAVGRIRPGPQAPVYVRITGRHSGAIPPAPSVAASLVRLWLGGDVAKRVLCQQRETDARNAADESRATLTGGFAPTADQG